MLQSWKMITAQRTKCCWTIVEMNQKEMKEKTGEWGKIAIQWLFFFWILFIFEVTYINPKNYSFANVKNFHIAGGHYCFVSMTYYSLNPISWLWAGIRNKVVRSEVYERSPYIMTWQGTSGMNHRNRQMILFIF